MGVHAAELVASGTAIQADCAALRDGDGQVRRSLLRDDARSMSRSSSRSSARGRLNAVSREYGVRVKLVACLSLVCVQLFASIVLKLAHAGGKYTFSPQSSLALSEIIKLGLSLLYILYDERSVAGVTRCVKEQSNLRLGWHMFGLEWRDSGERAHAVFCARHATERVSMDGDADADVGIGGCAIRRL
ncbi:hypothetical protein FGB62_5g313 [Gracilaria domingensis]|nr:hypothetical protein FGB62_5g313 [Gracilaria domingensis]